MKNCPVCNAQLSDECAFCTQCGAPQAAPESASEAPKSAPEAVPVTPAYAAPETQYHQQPNNTYYPPAQPYVDPYDHTKEFDKKDISDNKVIAMCVYLMGWIGILIALLASKESPFAGFHVRQALKIQVTSTLLGLIAVLLCWTFIVPIAAGVCVIILFVLRIIAFFQICGGKAKEVAIIRSLGFMR